MVASRQLEIAFSRGIGQQRGRGFGALAQVIGRTVVPFLRKNIVPAAKRVSADFLEFAAPEIVEVVSGRNNFKTAAMSVRRQILRKLLSSCSRKRTASRVIPTKSAKQTSRSRKGFYIYFSINLWINIWYQLLVAVSGNLGGKVPVVEDVFSSHEQEIHPTISLDEKCMKFAVQTTVNYYVDLRETYLALKVKFVRGRGYETHKTEETKKEH